MGFDDLARLLKNEEMKLTRSERQKLQRFFLSTIDVRLRSRLRRRVPRSGSESRVSCDLQAEDRQKRRLSADDAAIFKEVRPGRPGRSGPMQLREPSRTVSVTGAWPQG